jgi:hypothetical protein
MTVEEYIAAKQAAGFDLHLHDGVWWQNLRWGYCKPAVPLEEVDPVRQRPAFGKSAIGYAHRVPEDAPRSGFWRHLVMRRPQIAGFMLDQLESKRRTSIRKALRCNEIIRVSDLDRYRRDMTDIVISTAIRNRKGHLPDYYREQNDEWWQSIRRVSGFTEFWGAIHEGRMIAYTAVQVAGRRAVFDASKSMTEYLHARPNDALRYTLVESCRARGTIEEIISGGWSADKPTLNTFKESFGFAGLKIPYIRKMVFGLFNNPVRAPGHVES